MDEVIDEVQNVVCECTYECVDYTDYLESIELNLLSNNILLCILILFLWTRSIFRTRG